MQPTCASRWFSTAWFAVAFPVVLLVRVSSRAAAADGPTTARNVTAIAAATAIFHAAAIEIIDGLPPKNTPRKRPAEAGAGSGATCIALAKTALPFLLLWSGANYSYSRALMTTSASDVTAVFSATPALVYVLSLLLLGDSFAVLPLLAVLVTIGGIVLVALAEDLQGLKPVGIILTLIAAACAATYKVHSDVAWAGPATPRACRLAHRRARATPAMFRLSRRFTGAPIFSVSPSLSLSPSSPSRFSPSPLSSRARSLSLTLHVAAHTRARPSSCLELTLLRRRRRVGTAVVSSTPPPPPSVSRSQVCLKRAVGDASASGIALLLTTIALLDVVLLWPVWMVLDRETDEAFDWAEVPPPPPPSISRRLLPL